VISQALHEAIRRAQRHGGVAASIYLSTPHTDQLLAEMGMKRDGRCTRRPAVDRFNDVPVYPDADVSMVVCSDQAGEAYPILL
jgi:hypothetical protein